MLTRIYKLSNIVTTTTISLLLLHNVFAQINLGSFNLGKNPAGDLNLGFGQGGSLFGFGGDRAMNLNIGKGGIGAKSDGGLSLGGQRLGLESLFGFSEQNGLNFGSILNTGNPPPLGSAPPSDPLSSLFSSFMSAFKPSSTGTSVPTGPLGKTSPSSGLGGLGSGSSGFGGLGIPPPPSGLVMPPEGTPLSRGKTGKMPWEESGEENNGSGQWPTAPSPPDELEKINKPVSEVVTESPVFPTLIQKWEREDGSEVDMSGGLMPSGVKTGEGVDTVIVPETNTGVATTVPSILQITPVQPITQRPHINTEGWIGLPGESHGTSGDNNGNGSNITIGTSSNKGHVNSGEASKKNNGKRRGGPMPPEGLVDIDYEEELKRVRARAMGTTSLKKD